ncbi:hypothetical protein Nepgr_033765 [Nepenthes gracilis]|uniref:Uncharacterized protein n=1 Tax=Nepenthes gracilis TaxID=150966 RepID=A0AAD3Y949_NEPGR|nr:hypothetical protein Nepgr_033765 [Nepenthes gracilis]
MILSGAASSAKLMEVKVAYHSVPSRLKSLPKAPGPAIGEGGCPKKPIPEQVLHRTLFLFWFRLLFHALYWHAFGLNNVGGLPRAFERNFVAGTELSETTIVVGILEKATILQSAP